MKTSCILSLQITRPTLTNLLHKFLRPCLIGLLTMGSAGSNAASKPAVIKSPGQLVAVSFSTNTNGTNILSSPDGITWTRQFSGTTNQLFAIAVNRQGRYVAVGDYGVVSTSADGKRWAPQSSGVVDSLRGVAADNQGRFVAVGSYGTIVSSQDGISWAERRRIFSPTTLFGVAVNQAGKFVAVGDRGEIVTSFNGMSWTKQFNPTRYDLRAIAVNNTGLFVAVGSTAITHGHGFTLTSSDGTNWTLNPLTTTELASIAVNSDGLFVAGGTGGLIHSSPDGFTWTAHSSGTEETINSITVRGKGSGSELFFASCSGGKILSSPDGFTWAVQSTNTADNLTGITTVD